MNYNENNECIKKIWRKVEENVKAIVIELTGEVIEKIEGILA
ncbi:hypothetical protein [Bacillus sp. OK048]|nr:hypothetical protein [Bacillus sp. OK048]